MTNYQPKPADSDPDRPWFDPSRFTAVDVLIGAVCLLALCLAGALFLGG